MKIERPVRVTRSEEQRLVAPPEVVFPLLCPVREADWVPDWDPIIVLSESGAAEPGCVFVTRDADAEAIWVVTDHDPAAWRLSMVKVVPGHVVGEIRIVLFRAGPSQTRARVSYGYTALSPAGVAFVEGFTRESFDTFIRAWEDQLNSYLNRAV